MNDKNCDNCEYYRDTTICDNRDSIYFTQSMNKESYCDWWEKREISGLQCLRDELLKKGCTKSQAQSKVVVMTLEILSDSNGKWFDMDKLQRDIESLEKKKSELMSEYVIVEKVVGSWERKKEQLINEINNELDKQYKKTVEYLDNFFKAIESCETSKGKDALKAAQMYVNSVKIDTKYDNTAFIIGLASILAQGETAAIDELRKINKKIPKFGVIVTENGYEIQNIPEYIINAVVIGDK